MHLIRSRSAGLTFQQAAPQSTSAPLPPSDEDGTQSDGSSPAAFFRVRREREYNRQHWAMLQILRLEDNPLLDADATFLEQLATRTNSFGGERVRCKLSVGAGAKRRKAQHMTQSQTPQFLQKNTLQSDGSRPALITGRRWPNWLKTDPEDLWDFRGCLREPRNPSRVPFSMTVRATRKAALPPLFVHNGHRDGLEGPSFEELPPGPTVALGHTQIGK